MLFHTALLASLLVAGSAKKGLLAAHFPADVDHATIDWKVTDIGFYTGAVTTKDGLAFPAVKSMESLEKFASGAHANKKKAVLSIGGPDGSQYFSSLVKTKPARAKFVKQIQEVVRKNKLHGTLIDWRFPTVHGNPKNEVDPQDSTNLLEFLQDLRDSGEGWHAITVSVNGIFGPSGTTTLTDYKPFANVVDAFNVMAYDYVGSWTNQTGPDSPSQTCATGRSYISDIERFTEAGFPAGKVLLGVPSFCKAFTLHDSKLRTHTVYGDQRVPKKYDTRIIQTYDTYDGADYTYVKLKAQGILAGEDGLSTGKGYVRHYDHCSRTPFLFKPETKSFITYLDGRSASYRAQRSVEEGYLGVSVFHSAGFDDYGKCRSQSNTSAHQVLKK